MDVLDSTCGKVLLTTSIMGLTPRVGHERTGFYRENCLGLDFTGRLVLGENLIGFFWGIWGYL